MAQKEPLDYCRVKKIFDKGYGFLTSLHYKENVFFHFNNVKDPTAKEKLEKMKRGDVYFFFTSRLHYGKRKVDRLWLDIADADKEFIPDFTERIIEEFENGKTNPYEVAYVIKELRSNNFLPVEKFKTLISSERMLNTPSLIKPILIDRELNDLHEMNILIENMESDKLSSVEWAEKVAEILNI